MTAYSKKYNHVPLCTGGLNIYAHAYPVSVYGQRHVWSVHGGCTSRSLVVWCTAGGPAGLQYLQRTIPQQ